MKKKPLICICIPTYNRAASLSRLLESIITQKGFDDEVSIMINDGPSKDGTESMVRGYQKKYPNIKYSRNPVAVGMLPAILESIDMSEGEYTWIVGSDDFMWNDALEIMTSALKEKKPALALCNRLAFRDITECKTFEPKVRSVLSFAGFSDFGTYF
ncbi:MAG: glycosyltransferase family 2 protein [Patescibacteria group bacterium]